MVNEDGFCKRRDDLIKVCKSACFVIGMYKDCMHIKILQMSRYYIATDELLMHS